MLCCAVLCRAVPSWCVLCCGALCSVVRCRAQSCRGVSCHGVAGYALLLRAALCCAVLCRILGCLVAVRCTAVRCNVVCVLPCVVPCVAVPWCVVGPFQCRSASGWGRRWLDWPTLWCGTRAEVMGLADGGGARLCLVSLVEPALRGSCGFFDPVGPVGVSGVALRRGLCLGFVSSGGPCP